MEQLNTGMDRIIEKKFFTKKRIITYSGTAGIILLLFYFIIYLPSRNQATVSADQISINPVKMDLYQDYIVFTGLIVPEKTIYLDAMEGGRIEEVFIEEGTMVRKGDAIARLSNSDLQMNMMNREAELADQMNNLRNTRLLMEQNRLSIKGQILDTDYKFILAKRDFENTTSLYEKKMISKNEYLRLKEDYELLDKKKSLLYETMKQDSVFRMVQIEQLNDSVKRLQSNLRLIREKMDGLTIKAPVDGQLTSFKAEVGEAKNPGERLGTVNVISSYKIQADVSEYYLSRIYPGLSAFAELDSAKFAIVLAKVHPEVRNGSFQVDFTMKDSQSRSYHIGQSFVVRMELGKSVQALMIPKGNFYRETGGQWIFKVDKDSKHAKRVNIKLGRQNPDYYEVLEGLQAGDMVITSGYETFNKVEQLKIKENTK